MKKRKKRSTTINPLSIWLTGTCWSWWSTRKRRGHRWTGMVWALKKTFYYFNTCILYIDLSQSSINRIQCFHLQHIWIFKYLQIIVIVSLGWPWWFRARRTAWGEGSSRSSRPCGCYWRPWKERGCGMHFSLWYCETFCVNTRSVIYISHTRPLYLY